MLGAGLSPVQPLLIQYTIDGPIANGDYTQLAIALGIMVLLLVFNSVVSFYNTYAAGWLGQHIIRDMEKLRVYKIILKNKV